MTNRLSSVAAQSPVILPWPLSSICSSSPRFCSPPSSATHFALTPPLHGVDFCPSYGVLLSEAGLGTLSALLSNGKDEAWVGRRSGSGLEVGRWRWWRGQGGMAQSLHRISKIELKSFRRIRALLDMFATLPPPFSTLLFLSHPLTASPASPPFASPSPFLLICSPLIAHKIVFIAVIN